MWLAAMAGAVLAQGSDAGRFVSVTGDVRVVGGDGAQRAAQREAEFREGESIITGAGALAQLRMFDGALMSVRGDTEIKLDRFSYAGEQDRNASFMMSVLKGGLRTITGVIGRQNRERYRITTATVTIGVRGTDFEIVHVPPQAASREVPAGTYDRVFAGVTSMQNRAGVMLLVSREQTAFAALQGTTPPVLVAPPAALFGRPTPMPQVTPHARQDDGKAAPRVIFCTGPCFAVDQNGVRTPAPKGTTLHEGQRLETGPSAYAQLKLGPDAAVGVGERAQVRFDQTSLRDRDIVILDQGRIRLLSGEALGRPETRGVELRTTDGVFALHGADIELRKQPVAGGGGSSLTIVSLNAGDARLTNPGGEIAIAKGGVQGFTAGKVVTNKLISVADVRLAPVVTGADKIVTTKYVNPATGAPTTLRELVVAPPAGVAPAAGTTFAVNPGPTVIQGSQPLKPLKP
jgi:hypothetical protein